MRPFVARQRLPVLLDHFAQGFQRNFRHFRVGHAQTSLPGERTRTEPFSLRVHGKIFRMGLEQFQRHVMAQRMILRDMRNVVRAVEPQAVIPVRAAVDAVPQFVQLIGSKYGRIGLHPAHKQPHFEGSGRAAPPADISVLPAERKNLHPFLRRNLPCMVGIQCTGHRRLTDMRQLRNIRTRNFFSHRRSPFLDNIYREIQENKFYACFILVEY